MDFRKLAFFDAGRDSALRCPDAAARRPYLPFQGEGLGASRPDSIIVGRIGPNPSMFVPRDVEGRGELLCSTGVSLFTGLCSFRNSGIRHRRALDIRLARLG